MAMFFKRAGTGGPNAIKDKSAVSIRGIVTEVLRETGYWIVLDHSKSRLSRLLPY
jgi:hypothetical protein